jgi:hypothetical protein
VNSDFLNTDSGSNQDGLYLDEGYAYLSVTNLCLSLACRGNSLWAYKVTYNLKWCIKLEAI